MMKLPAWIRRADAAAQDLTAQQEAANAALSEATRAVDEAQAQWDAQGDETSLRTLERAETARVACLAHVARADRLVTAARAVEEEQRRASLTARRIELEKALSKDAQAAARLPLEHKAAAACLAMARADAERIDLERALRDHRRELVQVVEQLGGTPASEPVVPVMLSNRIVISILIGYAKALDADDSTSAALRKLIGALSPPYDRDLQIAAAE